MYCALYQVVSSILPFNKHNLPRWHAGRILPLMRIRKTTITALRSTVVNTVWYLNQYDCKLETCICFSGNCKCQKQAGINLHHHSEATKKNCRTLNCYHNLCTPTYLLLLAMEYLLAYACLHIPLALCTRHLGSALEHTESNEKPSTEFDSNTSSP